MMPYAVNQVYRDGQLIQSITVPWTMESIQEELRETRQRLRTASITVGGIAVSMETGEDNEWSRRETHIARGATQFPYTPLEGEPTLLTAAQVTRIIDCRDWYGNACLLTELMIWNAAKLAADLEPIGDAIRNDLAWPSRVLNFVATQADIDRDNQRMAFLASLGGAQ